MPASDLVNLSGLIDTPNASRSCASIVGRKVRAALDATAAPSSRDGHDNTQPCRQRDRCETCAGRFDDLTGTVLSGHRQPPWVSVLSLYVKGLNLSNPQIASEWVWKPRTCR